jgi:hypothetical protein
LAELISTGVVVGIVLLLAYSVAALLKVLRGGVATTDAMLRGGVTFGTLWNGNVPGQPSGSALVVREGMCASVAEDGSVDVVQTRTIARDAL